MSSFTSALPYQIQSQADILGHFPSRQFLVQDAEEDIEMLRKARIRSGDYIMTLATELERIAQNLAENKAPESHELERIITELLYIERNYRLTER